MIPKHTDQFSFVMLNSSTPQYNELREAHKLRPRFLFNLIRVLSKPGYWNTSKKKHISPAHWQLNRLYTGFGADWKLQWKNKICNSVTKNSVLLSNYNCDFYHTEWLGFFICLQFGSEAKEENCWQEEGYREIESLFLQ